MNDEPIVRLDPERLKRERGEVDLGAPEETGHDHVDREAGAAPRDRLYDPTSQPTAGATPPAR